MSTDHQRILAELKGGEVRRNHRYFKRWYIWPIVAPKGGTMQKGDSEFSDLQKEFRITTWMAREKATCISEATWRLAYQRTAMRQKHKEVQLELRVDTRIFRNYYRMTVEGG